jgi:diadenosine tetraphosphate (Ap4A) HIT family hydrolase
MASEMASETALGGRPDTRWRIAGMSGWTLYLNEDQGLLGRVYLMLDRPETDVTALTGEEVSALWEATRRVRKALDAAWEPDHYNFAFLMNQTPQVHWHIIPRYRARREFAGGTFVDPTFGGHYGTGPTRTLEPDAYSAIMGAIQAKI